MRIPVKLGHLFWSNLDHLFWRKLGHPSERSDAGVFVLS